MSVRDIRRHIGQLSIVGFNGHAVPVELRALAREFDLGGVILFARNVATPGQVAELAREVGQLARQTPLWVGVDQEGGRVARLRRPFTEWPPMAVLGRSGDIGLAERFARALAGELRAVGVTLDFAPVLDVHTNPANPVIGDRALAERPDVVASLGSAIIRTLQAEGVAACGKHFPGHGDTSEDSHQTLPVVEHDLDRLRAVELRPFRAAAEAGVAAVMMGHILLPALDADRPASLSSVAVDELLRRELGFDGLVVADDLEMKAVADRYAMPDAAVAAIGAGCDSVLLCGPDQDRQAAVMEALIRAAEEGVRGPSPTRERSGLAPRRLEAALASHRRTKERFFGAGSRVPAQPRSRTSVIGCDEHQAIAAEMAGFL